MENEKELLVAIEHLKARNMSAKHIDMAIKALERRIPKKVTEMYKAECIEDIEAYGENTLFGYCPMCDELQCSVWNANTCGDCGQALDWKVEE